MTIKISIDQDVLINIIVISVAIIYWAGIFFCLCETMKGIAGV